MGGQRFARAGLGPRARHRRLLFRHRLLARRRDLAVFKRELPLVGSSRSECRPNCARWNCRMMWCIRSTRRSNSSRSASSTSAAARRPGISSGSASTVSSRAGFDHIPPRVARSFGGPDSICRGIQRVAFGRAIRST
jgi:hypothetical protein